MPSHTHQTSGEGAASFDGSLLNDASFEHRFEKACRESASEQESSSEEGDDSAVTSSPYPASMAPTEVDAATIDMLHRSLGIHSQITTTSSFAERMEKAKITSDAPYNVIGRGSAGTVFEIPGTGFAFKKGSNRKSIWVDSQQTNLACTAVLECKRAVEKHFPGVSVPRVPRVHDWVKNEDMGDWWQKNGDRFVNVEEGIDDKQRGHLFCVQRILPLPKSAREALIHAYFPSDEINAAIADSRNKACLVRPYLGQRRSIKELNNPPDTLENFPLYLDQLLSIGLDIDQYAQEMAVGLAIIHWRAQLDGMDMEFVIGSATSTGELPTVMPDWLSQTPLIAGAGDFTRRTTHLWNLDFDKASPIDFLASWSACCKQMVTAVTANDPYFPNPVRPGREERAVWAVFEAKYLKAARLIVANDFSLDEKEKRASAKLPAKFIEEWKVKAQDMLDHEDGSFVQFE